VQAVVAEAPDSAQGNIGFMSVSKVRTTLESIGAISPANVVEFAPRTRDREVPVFVDSETGVIFIDDYYIGDEEYNFGDNQGDSSMFNLEDLLDTERRVSSFRPFYFGRRIVDFGCGAGNFLRSIDSSTSLSLGIEYQQSCNEALNKDGISCFFEISQVPSLVETAFLFHVLEHLPDPLTVLSELKSILEPDKGTLIVEVPHARDFLITPLQCEKFINFTLWSQHLVLHTRESLHKLLSAAGFEDIRITGVQRYGLSNHLTWLSAGTPGGHKGPLALFESTELSREYQAALAAQDCTDTLVAIARVGPNP
jgi:SAM-dependent methyltransferase